MVGFKEQDGAASGDKDSGRAATARQAATSTEEGRRRRGERALGKEDRTGFTGTSLLIIGGGVSWDYPPGSPLSGLTGRDSLFFGAGVRL